MRRLLPFLLTTGLLPVVQAQSVATLQQSFSGKCVWEAQAGHFLFLSSGRIDFKRDQEMSGIWNVPEEVKRITIAVNTRVTGQFTLKHSCTIAGADEKTSILYGTDTAGLLHDKGMDGGGRCLPYSAILGWGKIAVTVTNLTVLNPLTFMWTGADGARFHLEHVRGLDNRGGWHNHSDGLQAAKGSTIRDCYLECGDDAIKVYNDMLVENTTIKMIQNCVPIQLGWGSYGNGARGVFRNVTIIGERGRGRTPAVIEGNQGSYHKTIEITGLVISNANAAMVRLKEEGMELDLTVKHADITLKAFFDNSKGISRSEINGSKEKKNNYTADQSVREK